MAKREFLFRRNAVLEALQGKRRKLHRLWLKEGQSKTQTRPLVAAAQNAGITIKYAGKQRLIQLAGDSSHQNVVLEAEAFEYTEMPAILNHAQTLNESPFLLILDLVQGPQNIGMLLRTAEACGVHGVIMQDRRAPDITPHIVAFSAGATEHLLIAKETNIVQAMRWLKEQDVWLVGLDRGDGAQKLGEIDLNMPLALVVGHEGEGLRRLVRVECDFILELPMRGQVDSLNVAVAGSVALYSAWGARGNKLDEA